jgi:hypothetical protein
MHNCAGPNFTTIYHFLANLLDVDQSEDTAIQSLNQMAPLDRQTATILMNNLCQNLQHMEQASQEAEQSQQTDVNE